MARVIRFNDSEHARHLHLLGATGVPRPEKLNGRDYIVIPVIALMEGVIFPVNAPGPEFVPAETLKAAAETWNDKPIVIFHPRINGEPVSALEPDIVSSHIGFIKNSRMKGKTMLQDAWVDVEKTRALDRKLLERLMAGKVEEVSVGAYVIVDGKSGKDPVSGLKYISSWIETAGDHLAFLPGGKGACSVEMGCGTHRAAAHFVCAQSIRPPKPIMMYTALQSDSLDERVREVHMAVEKKFSSGASVAPSSDYAYAVEVFDDRVIVRKGDELFSVDYTVDDNGEVTLVGEPVKVEQVYIEMQKKSMQKMMDCPTCDGNGSYKGNPCPMCDGSGEVPMRQNAVRHEGGMWVVHSRDNSRRLGVHSTKEEAEAQCEAIARSLARQKVG